MKQVIPDAAGHFLHRRDDYPSHGDNFWCHQHTKIGTLINLIRMVKGSPLLEITQIPTYTNKVHFRAYYGRYFSINPYLSSKLN